MSSVPVSHSSARPTAVHSAVLSVGIAGVLLIGGSPHGQLGAAYSRYAISSSNVAPAHFATVEMAPAEQLVELHDASGLTWDQIARYFGVSRRAVHLWVSGGRMTASNAELLVHLARAVDGVRNLDPAARRQALLSSANGLNLVDTERARRSSTGSDINRSPEIGAEGSQA